MPTEILQQRHVPVGQGAGAELAVQELQAANAIRPRGEPVPAQREIPSLSIGEQGLETVGLKELEEVRVVVLIDGDEGL